LISAYKTTAKLILDEADIVEKTIDVFFRLIFEYQDMNKVMRIIKEQHINLIQQKMELSCDFLISVRKKNASKVEQLILDLRCVKVKEIIT